MTHTFWYTHSDTYTHKLWYTHSDINICLYKYTHINMIHTLWYSCISAIHIKLEFMFAITFRHAIKQSCTQIQISGLPGPHCALRSWGFWRLSSRAVRCTRCLHCVACMCHDGFSYVLLAKPAGSKLLCSAACRCFGCGMHVYGELLSELRVCSELLSGMLGRSLNCALNGIQQRFALVITLPYMCG